MANDPEFLRQRLHAEQRELDGALGESLDVERLNVDPAAPFCAACAEAREGRSG